MAGSASLGLFRRMIRQARPHWAQLGALFLVSLLSSPLTLLAPLPLKIVVDSVAGSRRLPRLLDGLVPHAIGRSPTALAALAIGLFVVVSLLGLAQRLARTSLRARVASKMVADVRARLFRRAQRSSSVFGDVVLAPDFMRRMVHDAASVERMIEGTIGVAVATVTLAGMLYVTAVIDRQLALVAVAIAAVLFASAGSFPRRLRRRSRAAKLGPNALAGLTTVAGTAALLLVGIEHVRSQALTLGNLLVVLFYVHRLYPLSSAIHRNAASLEARRTGAARALAALDEPPDVVERADARPLARARGAIAFDDVSFARCRPELRNLSFAVEPGARVAIVGASGADKDALISLLMRFEDPAQGVLRLDGVDLRDYKLRDLRRQLAVVPRNPSLFSATIAENIAGARQGASRDEIIAAADAASAGEFILQLPHGYDTRMGESGIELSPSQRRRIAMAGALLKDSPVLVLDDPMSAVGAESEAALQSATRRLMRGRTVILLTNRASTLEECTALIVLENGRVATDTSRSVARPRVAAWAAASPSPSNLRSHSAARAWSQLHPDSEPLAIEPLRVRKRKNMVYRLEGAAPGGAAVIAKRCPKAVASLERAVQEILSRLSLSALRHYGHVDEPESEYGWLFMEEATGVDYSNLLGEHRVQVARWLGLLHRQAADAASGGTLPDAGPGRYLAALESGRESMRQNLDNPVLTSEDVGFLHRTRALLDELAASWSRLERLCEDMPRTLVHGDFNGKNIRLRSVNGDATVLVFDWECAGWGVPAVDIAQLTVQSRRLSANPDLATYESTMRARWPEVSPEAWRRLAYCGTVFRALAALSWDARNLASDWAHNNVCNMRVYVDELEAALERLDWAALASGPPQHEAVVT